MVVGWALTGSANAQVQGQPLPAVKGQPVPQAQGKAAARSQPKAAADAPTPAAQPSGGLQRRVEQLEEQLVDMQVVIGTLESLAKGGGGGGAASAPSRAPAAPQAGAYSSSETARIDTMEMQIRALSSQLEQLTGQIRALDGRRSDTGAAPGGTPGTAVAGFGQQLAPPSRPGAVQFGTTQVSPAAPGGASPRGDAIGGLIASTQPPPPGSGATAPAGGPVLRDALPPAIAGGDGATPKQLYETAYGYLLQQDYGAAESAFNDFLQRFPQDQLASNAQYWLGESYFVRGQYKPAANAFLKGVQSYARGAKAPDSLLKLAMSLERLGQRDAACSSYSELSTRFPNAPPHVRNRATAERQRIGCA